MSTDTELIRRLLKGDEQASQALIEKYQDMVYSLARRMLGDEEEAKDAAQEVFLRVLDCLPRFRGECAFSTWLYRIVVNGCISRCKLRKRRFATEISVNDQSIQAQHLVGSMPSSLELVERQERDTRLHQAIAKLAESYRMVIVLYYFQEFTYEEIAQVLAVPVGTVKVRLFRAKHLLQRELRIRPLNVKGKSHEEH